jgi:hypothetical protein
MSEDPNKPTEPTQPGTKEGVAAEHGTHTPQANISQSPPKATPSVATQQVNTPVGAEPQRAFAQGLVQAQEKQQLNYNNPQPSTKVNPFLAGHRYNETAHADNFFTLVLDSSQHIHDAIAYFSDSTNRNRYTYDQQQLIISKIVRACQEFGIEIEGISSHFTT